MDQKIIELLDEVSKKELETSAKLMDEAELNDSLKFMLKTYEYLVYVRVIENFKEKLKNFKEEQ